jgi:hypothetical protein
MPDWVRTYASSSAEYQEAFKVFLAHTDEKAKIRHHLDGVIASLPERRTLIDVGAGNGTLTSWAGERFDKTIAIEPNPSLRDDLTRRCPRANVIPHRLAEVNFPPIGDLILCSHVLYYVRQEEWFPSLKKMASWLALQGVLVVILQSRDCDCSQVVSHFQGQCVDLVPFGQELKSALSKRFEVSLERVSAQVRTEDLSTAYTVAEFMLNLAPLQRPVRQGEVEAYLQHRCVVAGGGFRLSVDQDFLTIRLHQHRAGGDGDRDNGT